MKLLLATALILSASLAPAVPQAVQVNQVNKDDLDAAFSLYRSEIVVGQEAGEVSALFPVDLLHWHSCNQGGRLDSWFASDFSEPYWNVGGHWYDCLLTGDHQGQCTDHATPDPNSAQAAPDSHLCGAQTKNGKACKRKVSNKHGATAKCFQHREKEK